MLADNNLGPSSDHRKKRKAGGNTNVCHFFKSKAGCRFGDQCKFKHEVLSQDQVSTSEEVSDRFAEKSFEIKENEGLNQPQEATGNIRSGNPNNSLQPVRHDCEEPEIEASTDEPSVKAKQQICTHFLRQGWCRFGKRCLYFHPRRERRKDFRQKPKRNIEDKLARLDLYRGENDHGELNSDEEDRGPVNPSFTPKPLCRFYLRGHCDYGDNCKFQHGKSAVKSETAVLSQEQLSISDQRRQNTTNLGKRRGDLTTTDLISLRKTECEQMKKRFPKGKLQILAEADEFSSYKVEFTPTDPDWPFDIKTFCLRIGVPAQYPLNVITVELPDDDSLPSTLRGYIEKRSTEWLEEKQAKLVEADKVELVFRTFLRWFDRNLEDIVTEGLRRYQREIAAKAAGFEFIPAKPVSERKPEDHGDDGGYLLVNPNEEEENSEDSVDSEDDGSEISEEEEEGSKAATSYVDVERKGTEILLRNFQLRESAATLLLQKLAIIIQCGRCKSTTEFSTPAGRLNSIQCSKCNNEQKLVFRPAMAHHFSSVVGYLDLADCQPFDLILQDCLGSVSCLNCSKDMKLEGFVPGQVKQTWCQRCHKKMTIAADSVRFQQLQPSDLTDQSNIHQIKVNKPRRVLRDPAIQEGKPLPAEGTCKHYKKSFRWLRFPCCGKCYPCDICHDDKEGDHEMKFANRMICGFCCKEQPFAVEKPCVSCGSQMTKVHSAHWEGGRGCRDKLRMSRNDIHKYSNMSKTISKKSQDKQEAKKGGKKTTKLRHA